MKKPFSWLLALALSSCISTPSQRTERHPQSQAMKRKALVIISSARELPLVSPKGTPKIPVGFFLVELAKMLQTFEDSYDFTFVTADGRAPQVDLNGLDLNFHVQGASAPWVNAMSNFRNTDLGFGTRVRHALGLDESPTEARARRETEFRRRDGELETAIRLLGRLEVTEPLINTSAEVRAFRDEAVRRLRAAPEKTFLSLNDVVKRHRTPGDAFKLDDYDFVYVPGGHAPMVDLVRDPALGEVLSVMHEKRKLVVAICHGPVALHSARWRLDAKGEPVAVTSVFSGARMTTVSSFEEKLMLSLGYVHQPSRTERTKLSYFVDEALTSAGYRVEFGSPMRAGVQLRPGFPHVVYDAGHRLLTANGPQVIDEMTVRLAELLHEKPERRTPSDVSSPGL